MGPWTYYSPLWIGTFVAALIAANSWPALTPLAAWLRWTLVLIGCPAAGALCQFGLIGVQGAFAQVMPVPSGRTIRGRGAVVAGVGILGAIAFGSIAVFLAAQLVVMAAWILGSIAAAFLLLALCAYAWGLPAAARDFADKAISRA
ncbi:MAG: hypothetical protein U1D55_05780 [Phycisphaerae bacterium]